MVKHIVMYKLKNPTEENINAMIDKFMSMKGKIDILKFIRAGGDFVKSARSYDVCLECEFENKADLEQYAVHPIHIPVTTYLCDWNSYGFYRLVAQKGLQKQIVYLKDK